MSVRFLKRYNCYNEGETATFSEQHEDMLVKRHIAERVTLPQPDEEDTMAKGAANEPQRKDPSLPQNRQTTGTSSKTK